MIKKNKICEYCKGKYFSDKKKSRFCNFNCYSKNLIGKPMSVEARKNMSLAKIGKTSVNKGKKILKLSFCQMGEKNHMFGRPNSPEQKESTRKRMIGNKYNLGRKQTSEHVANRVAKTIGRKTSERTKKLMSDIHKKIFKPWLGKGPNHPNWIIDRSKLQKYGEANRDRRSSAYRDWRKQVWLRDNFKCKIANPDCNGRIEAHHILGWTEHPELRYIINNGITLCHFHHPRKRAEEAKLSPYFQGLVNNLT